MDVSLLISLSFWFQLTRILIFARFYNYQKLILEYDFKIEQANSNYRLNLRFISE